MANDVVNLIVGKEAFEQTGRLDKALQSNYENMLKLYELSQKFGKGGFSEAKTQVKQYNTFTDELNENTKEQIKLENNLIKTIARKNQATSTTARQLTREREELKEVNTQLRNQERANSNLVGAYTRLTSRLNLVRRQYKDVAVSEGEASAKAVKLRKELERLDNQVKSVDKSAGQFQRNVGNYPDGVNGIKQLSIGFKDLARNLVGVFGIVEGVRIAFDFAKESIEIARQAKGVEFAFNRLGQQGVDAFTRVKKSTRGLLSDLDIKRSLVELDNFNISLAESDVLMEFLAVRSAQTGTSIDKLKDSLVEGLSKESKLRIDNLGISASELNSELENTPDFVTAVANIAKREVAEAGKILDEASNSGEKFNASLKNIQVSFGNLINDQDIGIVSHFADILNDIADGFDESREGVNQFSLAIDGMSNSMDEAESNSDILGKSLTFIREVLTGEAFLKVPMLFGSLLKIATRRAVGLQAVIGGVRDTLKNTVNQFKSIDLSSPINAIKSFKNIVSNVDFDLAGSYDRALVDFDKKVAEQEQAQINAVKEQEERIADEKIKATRKTAKKIIDEEKESLLKQATALQQYLKNQLASQIVDADSVDSEFGVDENIETPSFEDSLNAFANFFGFDPDMMLEAWQDYVERMEKVGEEANLNGFFNDLKENTSIANERLKELAQQTGQELVNFTNAVFENRAMRIDEDIQRNNDYYADILDNENLTEEQRLQLQAERDNKNAQLERKRREEQRKQAIFNKAVSIAEIGINTAQAVTKNTAQLGLLPAIPINALTIALGAVQTATVLATPIPRYRTGKKKGQGSDSMALVNDGGRDEIKVGADGSVTRYTGRNVLDFVQKDDTIFPSVQAFEQDMFRRSLALNFSDKNGKQSFTISSDGIRDEIKKGMKQGFKNARPKVVVNIPNSNWINTKIRW